MLGGGAGHIADMIARMRQNRALSKQRRSRSKDTSFGVNKGAEKLVFQNPCPEKVQLFRTRIRKERRFNLIMKTLIMSVAFGVACWILYRL